MADLNRYLFGISHSLYVRDFGKTYRHLLENQWKDYSELKKQQEGHLRQMMEFAYAQVPYYHKLFKRLSLRPNQIREVEDLERLPILTKDTIENNRSDFVPVNLRKIRHKQRSTGGTTGTPFRYLISDRDRYLGNAAMMYRGWGYGGYKLGDRIFLLGGSSIEVGAKPGLIAKANEIARNLRMFSSFDMGDDDMESYVSYMNRHGPGYMRGYPSAIWLLTKWMEQNGKKIPRIKAVFCTAEQLHPGMRDDISRVLDCEVFNHYGLNDGGVSAYECKAHVGMHIDTERSIMEIVDADGSQITHGKGDILATNLHNHAMPLIRYRTGDSAQITTDQCPCGRGHRLLKEVLGRTVDILVTPDGKRVHGWYFLYIFWEHSKGIAEYQVVQESPDRIVIRIVPRPDFNPVQLEDIRALAKAKSEKWILDFEIVDRIPLTDSGKRKFIVNRIAGEN